MRHLILPIATFLVFISLHSAAMAQGKVSTAIGFNALIPTGDFGEIFKVGYGGSL